VLSAHPTEVQPEQGDAADLGAGHLGAAVHAAPGAGAADGAPRPRAAADLPRRLVPPPTLHEVLSRLERLDSSSVVL
jgi:hypothetical protein